MAFQPITSREKEGGLAHRWGLPALLPTTAAIVSLASLLLLLQSSNVTTSGYDLRRLEAMREDWAQSNYQLEAEIAYLQSLGRVAREAKEKLGMVPATTYLFVTVAKTPGAHTTSQGLSPGLEAESQSTQVPPWVWGILEKLRVRW